MRESQAPGGRPGFSAVQQDVLARVEMGRLSHRVAYIAVTYISRPAM